MTDLSGNPLPEASVTLEPGSRPVPLSAGSARFSLVLPAERGYELRLSLEGYESKSVGFEVSPGTRRRKKVVLDRARAGGESGVAFRRPEDMGEYMERLAAK